MTLRLSSAGPLLLALALVVSGCSSTAFEGRVDDKSPKSSRADDAHKSKKPRTGSNHYLDEDEEEEAPADRPAIVAGAFLTCVDVSESRDQAAFGCGVHRNGRRVDMSRLDASWWVERQGSRLDVEMRFPGDEEYDVYVRVPRSSVPGASLYVLVKGGFEGDGDDVLLSRRLDEDLLSFALQSDQRLGYHLGNGNFGGSSCQSRLSGEPVRGTTVYFDFRVDEPTRVAVTLTDLCGVDIRGTNRVELWDGALRRILSDQALTPGASRFDGKIVKLPPGEYTVAIDSAPYRSGSKLEHDDFLVGSIVLFSDHPIVSLGIEVENEPESKGGDEDPAPTQPIKPEYVEDPYESGEKAIDPY